MILYLHGFGSSAASAKAARLRGLLTPARFLVADYPAHRPRIAVETLRECVEQALQENSEQRLMLIGSSLGGFYAQYLGATLDSVAKVVLINPALQPRRTLEPYVGANTNSVTGEAFLFSRQDFADLARYDVPVAAVAPTLVLLDRADDLIDWRVAADVYRRRGRVVVYPGGSHGFEHIDEAAKEIRAFYGS